MPMFPRSRRARAAVAATAVAVVVGLTPSVVTGPADAVDGAFAPQLITVDTPTRADKEKLQRLGLDLTEHAGHDYNDDIRELAAIRPSIAKRVELPHPSLDGKTIYGVEIGADVRAAEDGRPVFLLMGVHHAREWPSGELAMEFALSLIHI